MKQTFNLGISPLLPMANINEIETRFALCKT